MTTIKTSHTDPIFVSWLPVAPGRLGLTFAPGKHQTSASSGAVWRRDLDEDLARLKTFHGVDRLICLLGDRELKRLAIGAYHERAAAHGLGVTQHPIQDGGTPDDRDALEALITSIVAFLKAGKTVVIHCAGGLGRAGTVGGCVLRALGLEAEATLQTLRWARGTSCPENDTQRRFIAEFRRPPKRARADAKTTEDRIEGAVLGGAIGDAMGHPTEFLTMGQIHRRYGPGGVESFELWWEEDGERFAPYTDDTQMAEVVFQSLLESRRQGWDLDATMNHMARGFVAWSSEPQGGHRAPGNACLRGCSRLAAGIPWRQAGGTRDGGCGSVMRAYPFGLFFAHDLDKACLWAAEHSRLTHNAPDAVAACAAMAAGVALAVRRYPLESIVPEMAERASLYSRNVAREIIGAWTKAVYAYPSSQVLDRWRGWTAIEALAAAVYLFARHPDDPREAILEGANTPGDSDSIASIAGTLVGAYQGARVLPDLWRRGVERSHALSAMARELARHGSLAGEPG